jgi:peptidoglycan/LPS O-acetylase OafA/YrhL
LGVPSAYLAVDLFFLMSGFIISFVYDDRFRCGMRPMVFMRARLMRLYPLYALGTFLSAASIAVQMIVSPTYWSWASLAGAVAAGALMLPSVPPSGVTTIFPLNGPAWSLFYEMLANMVYAAIFPVLTLRRLIMLVVLGFFAVALSAYFFGSLSGGALVGYPDVYTGGLVRVWFSFFAGVLLCRIYRSGHLPKVRMQGAWLLPASVACLFFVDPVEARPVYDLMLVVVVFPLLVALAVQVEPRRGVRAFTFLGVVSYPIYATHELCLKLLDRSLKSLGDIEIPISAPMFALALLAVLSLIGWYLDRLFDQPVRRWLTARATRQISLENSPPRISS